MVRRWLATLMMLAFGLSPALAWAAEDEGALGICFRTQEGEPIAGAVFRAYEVGVAEDDEITLAEPFARHRLSVAAANDGEREEAASLIERWAREDGVAPAAEAVTDESGRTTLKGLEQRVYLIEGDPVESADVAVAPQSFLATPTGVAYPKALISDNPMAPAAASPESEDAPQQTPADTYAKTADSLAGLCLALAFGVMLSALCVVVGDRILVRANRASRH